MELKITVSEEVALLLEEQAKAYGQDLNAFVETLLKTAVSPESPASPVTEADFEADMMDLTEGTSASWPVTNG